MLGSAGCFLRLLTNLLLSVVSGLGLGLFGCFLLGFGSRLGALCLGLAASSYDFNESPLFGGLAWVLVLGLGFLGFGLGLVWSAFCLGLGFRWVLCAWVSTCFDDFTNLAFFGSLTSFFDD